MTSSPSTCLDGNRDPVHHAKVQVRPTGGLLFQPSSEELAVGSEGYPEGLSYSFLMRSVAITRGGN